MSALDRAGYVEIIKPGRGRGSVTSYRITASGRRAFYDHIDTLNQIVSQTAVPAADRLRRPSTCVDSDFTTSQVVERDPLATQGGRDGRRHHGRRSAVPCNDAPAARERGSPWRPRSDTAALCLGDGADGAG